MRSTTLKRTAMKLLLVLVAFVPMLLKHGKKGVMDKIEAFFETLGSSGHF